MVGHQRESYSFFLNRLLFQNGSMKGVYCFSL